ncbi:Hypothetical protein, putative [Bodo saltans]|uniref:Uncharacterized protein n=1 Tax=Bodo saltans TaxID=75058 RepID=A0A0S4JMJ6_BODSA|nr:Hypothetical protein, putative [Bodo saltans]|eukprot:CUG91364.1 Hypothetical protein, putative [Bodo saltans]
MSGGDHVHAVPSSRPVLTAKVVRPPAEGDALQSSRRPCTATHRRAGIALVPVKFSGDRRDSPGRTVGAIQPHMTENVFTGAVRAAAKEVSAPEIASWPVQGSSSRLADVLARQAQSMDRETNPFLRADFLISSLKLLGDELKSFQPFFSVYVTELQVLVGRLAESQEECSTLRQEIAHASFGWEEKLRDQHVALSHEIRGLSQEIKDNKLKMKHVHEEGERLRKVQADLERDKKMLQTKETEWHQSRRVQEQMTVQIAQRNQQLQERIPPLEEEARLQKLQAETLRTTNQNMAHRATAKEKELGRVIHQLSDKITRQETTVDEANSHNRRLAASLHALRNVKDNISSELVATKEEVARIQRDCDEKLRCMTPRPDFESCPQELLGSTMSSSHAKVETLVGKLRLVSHNLSYAERASVATSAALSWIQKADASASQTVLQMPAAEIAVVPPPPSLADDGDVVAPAPERFPPGALPMVFDWPVGVQRVLCKAVTLADACSRAKELLDHCNTLQSRTSRHVELHVSILCFFLEGVALGDSTAPNGQYPILPASHSNRVPMSVYEHCMNVVRATTYFATEPCLRFFGSVLREELGPWVWGIHKKTLHEVMSALTAQDQLTGVAALALVQELLDEWPICVVLAVQRAVMQSVIPAGGTLVSTRNQPGDAQTMASLETLKVRVVWDRESALESALFRRLRTIFLEATVAFFQALESRLLAACHIGKVQPANLFDACLNTSIPYATVVTVVASVAPSLSEFQVNNFVTEVFELAIASARQEAAAAKTGPTGFEYLGPNNGPASSQLFLPGRAEHFFGSLRPYPQFVASRLVASRKQPPNQRRRQTLNVPRKSIAPVSPVPQPLTMPVISPRTGSIAEGAMRLPEKAVPSKPQKTSEMNLPMVTVLRFVRKVPLPSTFLKAVEISDALGGMQS